MTDVTVTDLRQNLPSYLKRVQKGQRIRITSRGRVIAELLPPQPTPDAANAARAVLKGSVRRYERPLDPAVSAQEWDVNR
jgi:prevent-host-death family protein